MKHLWEIDHPYYCTEGNYFSSQSSYETIHKFKSWADFIEEMGDADLDLNLLFRWDWDESDAESGDTNFNGDVNYRNGELKLFFMVQRKGFHSTSIIEVCRADDPAVIEYIFKRWQRMQLLWEPFPTPIPSEPT